MRTVIVVFIKNATLLGKKSSSFHGVTAQYYTTQKGAALVAVLLVHTVIRLI